jgi:hypothetical protein
MRRGRSVTTSRRSVVRIAGARPRRDRSDRGDGRDHVGRREQAAEPAAEDRGQETEDRPKGECVTKRVHVEIANAGDQVGRRADARCGEQPVVGGDAEQHEHEDHEKREERGHHPVPARAVARHPSGHVATHDVRKEEAEDDGYGNGDVADRRAGHDQKARDHGREDD